MNKKKIISVIAIMVILLIGSIAYKSIPTNEKITQSNEIMKEKEIEPTKQDKKVIKEVLENENIEYSYIIHDEGTVMLRMKYKEGLSDEEQSKISEKYLEELSKKYPGKNINTSPITEE